MVDTAQLVAEVKTKGVKKATAQLDKFGKEARQADKASDKFKKGATAAFSAVKVGAVAITGAAAALTALTIKVAAAQKEWQTLANIAGSSVDDFKATAFAAEQVGISAEKLADISKDTKEKLGEFVATGGGGFKDFFEQVAPQVGITAAELQRLSGPEVLQKVTNALNQANVPLAQQSFFLESIASDTTNLIPLLANEGAELNKLTGEYNSLNKALALSATDQKGLTDLSKQFNLLTETGSNSLAFLTSQFAPDLAAFINFVTQSIPTATAAIADFFDEFRDPENRRSISSIQETIAENLLKIEDAEKLASKSRSNSNKNNLRELKSQNEALQKRLELLQKEQAAAQVQAPTFSGNSTFEGSKQSQDRLDELKKFKDEQDKIEEDFLQAQDQRRLREAEAEKLAQQQKIQGIQSSLSTISSLTSSSNKELFRIGQAAALAQATINIAQGVTEALKLGPIVGPVLATGLVASGAVQIATIAGQSPPSAGSFANGGIIGGGSFAGDNITANVNSGEMILNRGQQKNLFDIANGGGGRGANVTVINNAPGAIAREETLSSGEVRIIVEQELSSQVLRPNSQFNKNLDKTRKVSRQL